MRVLIHAGPQKTGTTYLQTALSTLADRLAADGICYVRAAGGGVLHNRWRTPIAEALIRRPLPAIGQEFQQARESGVHTLLLSSERLAGLESDMLEPLRQATAQDHVEVVFYFRRWSDRLPAQWSQFVLDGFMARTFPDWLNRQFKHTLQSPYLNDALAWERWANLFGRASIRLVSYDVLMLNRISLLEHFLRNVLGWHGDASLEGEPRRTRQRLSVIETEILRELNELGQSRGERYPAKARMAALRRLRRAGFEPFASTMGTITVPIDDAGPALAAAAGAITPWIDRLVTIDADPRPFVPQRLEVPVADPRTLKQPAIVEALAEAHAHVLRFERRHAPDPADDDED